MALYDPIYGVSGQPTIQYPTQPVFPVQQAAVAPQQAPSVKIITVDGEAGAKSIRLAPGSTLFAADEKESVIWFIKANDVGPNMAVSIPFDPSIFNGGTTQPVDLSAFETRLSSIEERMSRYESNSGSDKQHSGNSSNNRR